MHETGANMVRGIPGDIDADLALIVERWLKLPEHVKAAIMALVKAGGKE